jgi:DNA primase
MPIVILSSLKNVKKSTKIDQWYASCPLHLDSSPSLCITKSNQRILMHCFSCNANGLEIANYLNLDATCLFVSDL